MIVGDNYPISSHPVNSSVSNKEKIVISRHRIQASSQENLGISQEQKEAIVKAVKSPPSHETLFQKSLMRRVERNLNTAQGERKLLLEEMKKHPLQGYKDVARNDTIELQGSSVELHKTNKDGTLSTNKVSASVAYDKTYKALVATLIDYWIDPNEALQLAHEILYLGAQTYIANTYALAYRDVNRENDKFPNPSIASASRNLKIEISGDECIITQSFNKDFFKSIDLDESQGKRTEKLQTTISYNLITKQIHQVDSYQFVKNGVESEWKSQKTEFR